MSARTITYRGPTIILEGGRRDGWVYYVDDWDQQTRAEAHAGRTLPYVKTAGRSSRGVPLEVSPSHEVWAWRP